MSNGILGWLLAVSAGVWTMSWLHYASQIGQERKPIKASYAAWDLLISAGSIVVVALAAGRLV